MQIIFGIWIICMYLTYKFSGKKRRRKYSYCLTKYDMHKHLIKLSYIWSNIYIYIGSEGFYLIDNIYIYILGLGGTSTVYLSSFVINSIRDNGIRGKHIRYIAWEWLFEYSKSIPMKTILFIYIYNCSCTVKSYFIWELFSSLIRVYHNE